MKSIGTVLLLLVGITSSVPYYGRRIGKFSTYFHDVKGDVYAVDDKTLFIKGFSFDGMAADAFFWAGTSIRPDATGFVIAGENSLVVKQYHQEQSMECPFKSLDLKHNDHIVECGSFRDMCYYPQPRPNTLDLLRRFLAGIIQSFIAATSLDEPLKAYKNQDLVLRLPDDKSIKNIRWLSVWSKKFRANFGSLIFPKALEPPKPVVIGSLNNTQRGVSSGKILILDTQTFFVPDFSYDGTGQDVHWWLSRGMKSNTGGLQLRDENGSEASLKKYKNQIVVITLPEGHSVLDYNIFSLWSTEETDDYGSVRIPRDIVVPPSPRALGLSTKNKLNCEMLNDDLNLETRWMINGDHIIMQLIGNIGESEYMALGLSMDDTETKLESSDAIVAWIGPDGHGRAVDFYLQSAEKCGNGLGMCPDVMYEGSDNLVLLNAVQEDQLKIVTFKRPLNAGDQRYDQNIYTDGPQAVLWAVGPLSDDGLPGPPKIRTKGNLLLDFGREPIWNCPQPNEETASIKKEKSPKIHCPSDASFRAQMGPPTGGSTERVWYINGLPTPELTLQRGKTYTFIVEGGTEPSFHNPLYITSSSDGGLYQSIQKENASEVVYAGVERDSTGSYTPTAEGRLCNWSTSETDFITSTFGDALPDLSLHCESGNVGQLTWTPDSSSPEYVYYQSFTKKSIGGKIRIVDFCEETKPYLYFEERNANRKTASKGSSHAGKKPELEMEYEDLESVDRVKLNNSPTNVDEVKTVDSAGFNFDTNFEIERKDYQIDEERVNSEQLNKDNVHRFNTELSSENTNNVNAIDEYKSLTNTSLSGSLHDLKKIDASIDSRLHPHDESERSDINVPEEYSESDDIEKRDDSPSESRSVSGVSHKQQRQSHFGSRPSSNVLSKTPRRPPVFNPQLEGGFVPLVLNADKAKEASIQREIVLPPNNMRRYRPFLFNESVPFHGTFKPGVPDFSGFNVSYYSVDELPLLSAPKPVLVHMPLSPEGDIAQKLLQRPKIGLQRPEVMKYGPHLPGSAFGGQPHPYLPAKHWPPFGPIKPNEDDLAQLPSQRVQVSLQASGNEKLNNMPNIPALHGAGIKRPFGEQRKIPLPIIQRRPDFVEAEDTKNNPLKRKPFLQQRLPGNVNKNTHQKVISDRVPSVRPQNQFPFRKPQIAENLKANEKPMNSRPNRRQHPEPPRLPYALLKSRLSARPPLFPNEALRQLGIERVVPESDDISFLSNKQILAKLPIHLERPDFSINKPGVAVVGFGEKPALPKGNLIPATNLNNLRHSIAINSHPNLKELLPLLRENQSSINTEILNRTSHQNLKMLANKNASLENQFDKKFYEANRPSEIPSEDDSSDAEVIEIHSNISPLALANMGITRLVEHNNAGLVKKPDETFAKAINEAIREGFGLGHKAIKLNVPFGSRINATEESEMLNGKPLELDHHSVGQTSRRQPQFGVIPLRDSVDDHSASVTHKSRNSSDHDSHVNPLKFLYHDETQNNTQLQQYLNEKSTVTFHASHSYAPSSMLSKPVEIHASHSNTDGAHTLQDPNKIKNQADVKLPQISEAPPSNDNGTDYSILNHVLALIGKPPQSVKALLPL